MKSILPSIIFVLICNLALADGHEDCAMMKGDAIDPEEFSEILGKKVYFCCGTTLFLPAINFFKLRKHS